MTLRKTNTPKKFAGIILQRIVPHYRAPLFRALYKKMGWIVVCAENPINSGFKLAQDEPWLFTFPMKFSDPSKEYKASINIEAFLQEFPTDLIICEFSLSLSWTLQLLRKRLFRKIPNLVFWTHGYNHRLDFSFPKNWLKQALRIALYAGADGIVCYSDKGSKWVQHFLPWQKVITASNTIDIEALPGRERALTSQENSFHILSVGRLTPDKQFAMLVRVFRKLKISHPKATLTIVGGGPEYENILKEAGSELDNSVFLPGAIYDDVQLSEYFLAADLFVYCGAIGLSANQALGYGLPIVIFEDRIPNGPLHSPEEVYIIDNSTGWRVSPATSEAMQTKLDELANLPTSPKVQLAQSIRQLAERKLKLVNMVNSFDHLNKLVGR